MPVKVAECFLTVVGSVGVKRIVRVKTHVEIVQLVLEQSKAAKTRAKQGHKRVEKRYVCSLKLLEYLGRLGRGQVVAANRERNVGYVGTEADRVAQKIVCVYFKVLWRIFLVDRGAKRCRLKYTQIHEIEQLDRAKRNVKRRIGGHMLVHDAAEALFDLQRVSIS